MRRTLGLGLAAFSLLSSTLVYAAPNATNNKCTFSRDLKPGDKGDDVKCLQGVIGITADKANGYYGELTKSKVREWQNKNGITTATGTFGQKSRAKYSGKTINNLEGKKSAGDTTKSNVKGSKTKYVPTIFTLTPEVSYAPRSVEGIGNARTVDYNTTLVADSGTGFKFRLEGDILNSKYFPNNSSDSKSTDYSAATALSFSSNAGSELTLAYRYYTVDTLARIMSGQNRNGHNLSVSGNLDMGQGIFVLYDAKEHFSGSSDSGNREFTGIAGVGLRRTLNINDLETVAGIEHIRSGIFNDVLTSFRPNVAYTNQFGDRVSVYGLVGNVMGAGIDAILPLGKPVRDVEDRIVLKFGAKGESFNGSTKRSSGTVYVAATVTLPSK